MIGGSSSNTEIYSLIYSFSKNLSDHLVHFSLCSPNLATVLLTGHFITYFSSMVVLDSLSCFDFVFA